MLQLKSAGLLAKARLKQPGNGRPALMAWRRLTRSRVEAVKNKQVTLRIVHSGKCRDTLEVIQRRERVHLVVINLVPGDIPAGPVRLNAHCQIHRAEVVADRG